jgi:opacity protein-like surface antigen
MKLWVLILGLLWVAPAWAQFSEGPSPGISPSASAAAPAGNVGLSPTDVDAPVSIRDADLIRFDYFSIHGSLIIPDSFFSRFPSRTGGYVDSGWNISGVLGKQLSNRLRGEIELGYRKNSDDHIQNWDGRFHDNSDIDSFSGMANLTLHRLPDQRRFYPYAGIGLGLSAIDGDLLVRSWDDGGLTTRTLSLSDTALAYQWFVGGALRLNSRAEFFSEFRRHRTGEFDLTNPAGEAQSNHRLNSPSIIWGLRIFTR